MYKTIMRMGCDPEFGNSSRRPSFMDLQETILRQESMGNLGNRQDDTNRYIAYSAALIRITRHRTLLGLEPANYENTRTAPEDKRIIGADPFWENYEGRDSQVA